MYVEGLIGADTVNTLPLATINAFRDRGRVRLTLDKGIEEAEKVLAELKQVGVDLVSITEQLQRDGVKAFIDSFDQLLAALAGKGKV